MKTLLQLIIVLSLVTHFCWAIFFGVFSLLAILNAFQGRTKIVELLIFVYLTVSIFLFVSCHRAYERYRRSFDSTARNLICGFFCASGLFHSFWVFSKWNRGGESGYILPDGFRTFVPLIFVLLIALVLLIYEFERRYQKRSEN